MKTSWLAPLGIALATVALLTAEAPAAPKPLTIDEALERSQNTGRPILTVIYKKGCPRCKAVLKHMAGDASLKGNLSKCVPLLIDISSDDWPKWQRKHPLAGNKTTILMPVVYVVRGDGKQMFGADGAVTADVLPKFSKSNSPRRAAS